MNNKKIYLIAGGVILLLLIVFYVLQLSGEDSNDTSTELNDTTKIEKPINASGTFILLELLKTFENTHSLTIFDTDNNQPLKDQLPIEKTDGIPNLYVSINNRFYLYKSDVTHLLDFVSAGNYAFISSKDFVYHLEEELLGLGTFTKEDYSDTQIAVNYDHPDYTQQTSLKISSNVLNFHNGKKVIKWTQFVNPEINDNVIKVAYNPSDSSTIAIIIPYGEGSFMLQTQPESFSNININTEDGKKNAEILLSHFPLANLHWHKSFGKYSSNRNLKLPEKKENKKKKKPILKKKQSPLKYIFEQPALFAAFILSLIGVILYVLIFSKRKQKIIPPTEDNKNLSLDFVNVVSKLFYSQKQHNKLVVHKFNIFKHFLRERYYINTSKIDRKTINLIIDKSGISEKRVNEIFALFKKSKGSSTDEDTLIALHKELTYFYKNCN